MAVSTINSDVYVAGTLSAKALAVSAGAVADAQVAAAAGIQATKCQQQHQPWYSQEGGTNAAAERRVVHVVKGATATLVEMVVGAVVAATGNATATIDLKKNGTTILTGTISLTSATAAYATVQPAGYTSTSLVAGDVFEVHVTAVNAGTGTLAKGLFARLVIREDPQ